MAAVIQSSFGKGEVSPTIYGRVDSQAYHTALRRARNLIIHPYGGASTRPGSYVLGPVKNHAQGARLIPFVFRTSDQYELEFGDQYMRVIRNDGHVLNAAKTITAVTQGEPAVVTSTAHGFANGEEVFITGVVGMTQLNGRRFTIANVTANTFELTDQITGANINSFDYTAYASGGTAATIFELATPYAFADLAALTYTQSADVMTLTHPSYAARDLTRTNHNAWTLTINTFAPSQDHPTGVSITQTGAAGTKTRRYRVTAIRQEEDVFEESLPALSSTSRTITGATNANPIVITATAHGYANGDEVEINSVVGMTEINGRRFYAANVTANTFELEGEDGTGYGAYSSGGTANATFEETTLSASTVNTDLTRYNTVSWTAVAGADRYAIYRRESGRYGLIGEVDAPITSFDDVTDSVTAGGAIWAADLAFGPPRARNPFLFSGDWPAASSYYEQRQVYGGTNNNPDTSFYSQTGNRANMSVATPSQADDAITVRLNARKANTIRHFVPGNDLLIFTADAEWRVTAGDNSGFAADTLRQKPQSEWGCSTLIPQVVGEVVLFVTEDFSTVRSFNFSFSADKYTSDKLNLLADHLLAPDAPDEKLATDWAFAYSPDGRLLIVRDDGQMLTMTFDPANDVVAWTTWDTFGRYEAVSTLKKAVANAEDGIYVVTRRVFGTQVVRYIERFASQKIGDVREAHHLDFGFELDSPLTITNVDTSAGKVVVTSATHGFTDGDDVDITGIEWVVEADDEGNAPQPSQLNDRRYTVINSTVNTFEIADSDGLTIIGATQDDPVVLSVTGHGFATDDVVYVEGVGGMTEINDLVFRVGAVTTDTFELRDYITQAPINGLAYGAWTGGGLVKKRISGAGFVAYDTGGEARETFMTLSGLWFLEGQKIAVVADGDEVQFATDADATVTFGQITLPSPASRAHVGFKYVAELETLNVEAGSGTMQGRRVKVPEVTVRFYKSRLPLIGPNGDDLTQMPHREDEEMGLPNALYTGDRAVDLPPEWNSNGQLTIRQVAPFPMTVQAIVPRLTTEDIDDEG